MLKIEYDAKVIIPAIRRAICLKMLKMGMLQKDIAELFDITEACFSQYKTRKRASQYKLKESTIKSIDLIIQVKAIKHKNDVEDTIMSLLLNERGIL